MSTASTNEDHAEGENAKIPTLAFAAGELTAAIVKSCDLVKQTSLELSRRVRVVQLQQSKQAVAILDLAARCFETAGAMQTQVTVFKSKSPDLFNDERRGIVKYDEMLARMGERYRTPAVVEAEKKEMAFYKEIGFFEGMVKKEVAYAKRDAKRAANELAFDLATRDFAVFALELATTLVTTAHSILLNAASGYDLDQTDVPDQLRSLMSCLKAATKTLRQTPHIHAHAVAVMEKASWAWDEADSDKAMKWICGGEKARRLEPYLEAYRRKKNGEGPKNDEAPTGDAPPA